MNNRFLIPHSIWDGVEFIEYSTNKKLLYICLIGNPFCEISGIYKISPRQISCFINISEDSITELLKDFDPKVVEYDFDTRTVFVKDLFKYNLVRGGNPDSIYRNIEKNLKSIENKEFVLGFLETYAIELSTLTGKTFLYVISLKSDCEEFIKVGISNDCRGRFKRLGSYGYEIHPIFKKKYNKRKGAVTAEKALLSSEIKKDKYTPLKKFDGSDECFNKMEKEAVFQWLAKHIKL